jgi:hypothetical protein
MVMLVPPVRLLPSPRGIRVTDCHGYRTLALIPTSRDRRAAAEAQTLTWEDGQEIARLLARELTAKPEPPKAKPGWLENLSHEVGLWMKGDKLVEVLARTGNADVGRAAFLAAIWARPGNHIMLKQGAWVLADTEQPDRLLPDEQMALEKAKGSGARVTSWVSAVRRIRDAIEALEAAAGLVNQEETLGSGGSLDREVTAIVAALGRVREELERRRAADSPPTPQPLYHPSMGAQASGGGDDR